jgi:hypothetical protein
MTNEFLQKLLEILTNIHLTLGPIPFWQNFSFWGVVVSAITMIVLAITLYWLKRYTRATEQIATYQITPAIDVNISYNPDSKKTYFWFSNTSNLPGKVYLKHKKNNEVIKDTYTPLRVPPKRSMKTADADFGFSPSEGDKITLFVVVTPAIDNSKVKIEFEKSYRFSGNKWLETSWGFPDPPFSYPTAMKKCSECKMDIPFDARKCRYCLSVLGDN